MNKIKAGDVLVFRAGDDWIGKTIAWLTDSDVSHAAIMLEDMTMAEMGMSGIRAGEVEIRDGHSARVLRMIPEKDMEPVLAAAEVYVNCKTRYDFPALAILAGLIIYRRIRPTPRLIAITDLLLQSACVALDALIQRLVLKNPDKALVCSQLVYQVYDDCGKEYRLHIENGLLQTTADCTDLDGTICLAEMAADSQVPDLAVAGAAEFPSQEELAKELYLALEEQGTDVVSGLDAAEFGTMPAWAGRFLDKLEEFLEKSGSNLPINALFITPADLAYKTTNLKQVDEIDLIRR